ncbi:bifunctional adenosylcobinamide kinase/adenosylcobinamide-phosphate guanylyltransferase [Algirhabdus cladophorae]|uniref:bifunctional adenosylcobinamide kinase/adenosylcobinamide-phosphate guanylyltransferase n=1 Tax=Algirhabdus cladophorae TaxID=3377108 RepID=UPI003B84B5E7
MTQKKLPKLTMVLGAASSGKSKFAESMIFSSALPRNYIATSQVWDDETQQKIAAHQTQRGPDWLTIEEAFDLPNALSRCARGSVTLIDCATLWLTNHLLAEADIKQHSHDLFLALGAHPDPVIIVTNEVGAGIVPDTSLGRQFRGIQGAFNQSLATHADLAVQVIAGLPQVLKGQLP